MALPENDSVWPPAPWGKAYTSMAGWDAWYAGDMDRLQVQYASGASRPGFVASGGLNGAMQRFFHGDRTGNDQTTRLHVPIPADLARTSADLLFAEPPRFMLPDEQQTRAAQERLALVLGGPETTSVLLEAAEVQSALGGVFMRVVWNRELFEHVRWAAVHADGAIPEFTYGQMSAVTFWRVLPGGDERLVWRYLERHSKGVIQHAVYLGTSTKIGRMMALTDHPDTRDMAASMQFESDGISVKLPGDITGPTAVYVPNIKPNPSWRNEPGLAALGRSDFDQLDPLFDAADESYSSMVRELRLGKARAFVDQSLTESNGRGRGSTFNSEAEMFVPVEGLGSLKDGAGGIQPYQPDLRIQAHRQIIEEITATVLRSAGYTASAFGTDQGSNMTATEVNSKRELSGRTRTKKIAYWRAAMDALATTSLRLEKEIYGGFELGDERVTTKFPIRTEIDPLTMAQTLNTLNMAEAISLPEKVRMRNPNWTRTQIETEVKDIQEEQRQKNPLVQDPTAPPPAGA